MEKPPLILIALYYLKSKEGEIPLSYPTLTLLIFFELAENTHDFNRECFKLNGCKTALDGQKKTIVLFSWNLN